MGGETRAIPAKLEYQPALDGLRAIAVLAVLAYHQGNLRGGFLGVDVFFVLSGFLITSLLLIDHHHRGKVVSLRFWARRARRLFPALLVFLVLVAIFAATEAKPTDLSVIREGSFATLFYFQNYWVVHHALLVHYPLSHTWSLSIEEQFYAVWPLLLAVLLRVSRRATYRVAAVSALVLSSALLMAVRFSSGQAFSAYLSTETRVQELLVGAVLALLLLGWRGPTTRARAEALEVGGAVAAVVLVVAAGTTTTGNAWLYRGGFLALALASAVLIAAAVTPTSTRLRRILSWRPLVAVGLISYGLYLYHRVLYRFVDNQHVVRGQLALTIMRYGAAFVVAAASYLLIERPIRRGALSAAVLRVVAPVAVATVVVLVFVSTSGSKPVSLETYLGNTYSQFAAATPTGSVRVLVTGDSLAISLGYWTTQQQHTGAGIQAIVVSQYGCDALGGSFAAASAVYPTQNCPALFRSHAIATKHFDPAVVVLMLGPSAVFDRVSDGHRLRFATSAYETYLDGRLDALRSALTTNGARLVLTTAPCMNPPAQKGVSAIVAAQRDPSRVRWVNGALRRYAIAHRVELADLGTFLCPGDSAKATSYRTPDGVGFSATGTSVTWQWLAPVAIRAARG